MKKLIHLFFVFLIVISSCKKNDPVVPPSPDKYMNAAAGSTWNYELVNNTLSTTNLYTLASTSRDSSINGKPYHVYTNSSGSSNEYLNISGNNYYGFRSLPAALGGSSIENIYLKDNVAAGTSWNDTYAITLSNFPLSITVTNTISEKGINKTINGTTYSNVIHVTTALAVKIAGLPLPAGALQADIQNFYAPKVGMILSSNKININYSGIVDNTDQVTSLKSANIK